MGLDGFVRCNCVEKGIAKPPPEIALLVKLEEVCGTPYLESEDRRQREVFSRWQASGPCPHRNFTLASSRLGNIAYVGRIRRVLGDVSHDPETEFPIVRKQVVYTGSHCGDAIPPKQAGALQSELRHLRGLVQGEALSHIVEFLDAMDGLVSASLQVGKPIGF